MSKTVVCFGDSNTYGYNPSTGGRYPEDIRWTGRLQKLLGDEYRIIEEGCNGRTTVFDDICDPWKQGRHYLLPCLNSHKPVDILIIMLGSNDLKKEYNASPEEIADGIAAILTDVKYFKENKQEDHPMQVLLMSPPEIGSAIEISPFATGFDATARARSQKLAPLYKAIAIKNGIDYLNAAEYAKASDEDSLHLTPEAHKNLAEVIAKKIKSIQ